MSSIQTLGWASSMDAAAYAEMALPKVLLPYSVPVQMSEQSDLDVLLVRIARSGRIMSSGSFDNITRENKINWRVSSVEKEVSLVSFILIKMIQGDPLFLELKGILNCFSAQGMALAIVIIDEMLKSGIGLDKIDLISDLNAVAPLQQFAEDSGIQSPIVDLANTRFGVDTSRFLVRESVFAVTQNNAGTYLYIHNQGIDIRFFENLHPALAKLIQVHAVKNVNVLIDGKIEKRCIVDCFTIGRNLLAMQGHADYGPGTDALIRTLQKAVRKGIDINKALKVVDAQGELVDPLGYPAKYHDGPRLICSVFSDLG